MKYNNKNRVTYTVICTTTYGFTLQSMRLYIIEMKELQEVIKDLKALRILRTDVNSLAKYKEATKRINTNSYEILLQARDDGQKIQFLTKDSGNIIEELLLLVGGESEFIMLSFVGNLDLDKIAKLASKLDIDGAEHLSKLQEK